MAGQDTGSSQPTDGNIPDGTADKEDAGQDVRCIDTQGVQTFDGGCRCGCKRTDAQPADKWVALVGLLDGYPYEIFTGLQDDDDGILLPKSVTKGKIIKQVNEDGTKRYDFQFENTRGYKITVEGLSEKFNPEYWNYAKLISGVLRYRMPLEHVIKLVSSLQLQSENINTWKVGVERALKKYIDGSDDGEQ